VTGDMALRLLLILVDTRRVVAFAFAFLGLFRGKAERGRADSSSEGTDESGDDEAAEGEGDLCFAIAMIVSLPLVGGGFCIHADCNAGISLIFIAESDDVDSG